MAATDDAASESPLNIFDDVSPSKRNRWRPTLITLGIIIVLGGLYVGLQFYVADRIPGGTTVGGVAVGGMNEHEAAQAVTAGLASRVEGEVTVTANKKTAKIHPAKAGLSLNAEASVSGLTGFTLNPVRLFAHIAGGKTVTPQSTVDHAALTKALEAAAQKLVVEPKDGTVTVVDGQAVSTAAAAGTVVDVAAAAEEVTRTWLTAESPIALTTKSAEPSITQATTDAAQAAAKTIVSASVWVEVGGQRAELPQSVIADALTVPAKDGALTPTLDAAAIHKAVQARTKNLETKAVDASFVFKKGKPTIADGKAGTTLDQTSLAAAVLAAAQEPERTATVALVPVEPKITTAALQKLGVKEIVSEFSTPLTTEPIRTKNLALAAKRLTGKLVMPGETFSITEAVGPVTAATGYLEAGVVVNGFHTKGMGGGLSQMATTSYNAGFFAGMIDVEHRPHTEWFSRYPAGREATIYTGSIDMRWRNDSPYGVVMQSFIANGKLTVRAWSTKYYTVTTSTSGKYNVQPTTTTYTTAAGCVPSYAGNAGFSVTVSRKVVVTSTGKQVVNEKKSWTYKPSNAVVCSAKPPAKKDSAKASG